MNVKGIGMTSQRTRNRLIERLQARGIEDQKVLDVMRSVPRHLFLDEALANRAYEDVALPIGHQQTISQPYIVARMTELLLAGRPLEKVLEVGTGSGYQTAVLSHLVRRVYSVERIQPLQEQARQRFRALKLNNIHLKHADGGFGWPERGPFDGILSCAAPEQIPQGLSDQLSIGARLVIPVGNARAQELWVLEKTADGIEKVAVEPVMFVPLQSGVIA
jgi:protein-L-isoaspartate(D-aspartate) O-methyltransferase